MVRGLFVLFFMAGEKIFGRGVYESSFGILVPDAFSLFSVDPINTEYEAYCNSLLTCYLFYHSPLPSKQKNAIGSSRKTSETLPWRGCGGLEQRALREPVH